MSDLNVVEQTCNMLESEKMELLDELETARELFDQRESEFVEQSQLLIKLQSQMAEIHEERQHLEELRVNNQLADQFGAAQSQADARSNS